MEIEDTDDTDEEEEDVSSALGSSMLDKKEGMDKDRKITLRLDKMRTLVQGGASINWKTLLYV